MLLVYRLLLYMAVPLAFGVVLWRGLRDVSYRDRLGERFGFTALRFDRPPVWVHAVSVGEVQAAAPLIRRLLADYPHHPLVVSTGTPTGAARVRSLFGDTVRHCYLPYDLPGAVHRFLNRLQPRLAIVLETELWPHLLRECGRRAVPVLLASARISPRSAGRYRRLAALFRGSLSNVVVAAQSEDDAQRFRLLGTTPEHTQVTGNIKFDIDIPVSLHDTGRALRERLGRRPVWVAGSTHEGEEGIVLDAHRRVLIDVPDALLVLAPRHPQRFEQVRALLGASGLRCVTRSGGIDPAISDQVLLLDTLGELTAFYAAGDLAFVAGSLVPVGGHNFLEPAALGIPILSGPYTFNAAEIARMFFDAGAALPVESGEQLGAAVAGLLQDESRRRDIGSRGQALVGENRGALGRVMELIGWTLQKGRQPPAA